MRPDLAEGTPVAHQPQRDERSDPDNPEWADDLQRYERFGEVAGDAIVGGEALEPSAQAVTIRYQDGGSVVTDGPYTESTEVVGGLFVLEADDLDAAIDLARQIPAAEDGAVEVRPLVEWFQHHDRPLPTGARRYLALLAGQETEASKPGTPAWEAAVDEHARFGEEAAGAIVWPPSRTANCSVTSSGLCDVQSAAMPS